MAMSRTETQIEWSSSDSTSVSSGSAATSDAFTLETDCIALAIQCKADNAGTPASGDTLDVYILWTCGDPDGASTDEYDSTDHGMFVCQLDTDQDDPAIRTVDLPVSAKGGKVYVESNAASNSITASAALYQLKSGS